MPDLGTDINVPLLRKTLEHITAHPEQWDQHVWMRELWESDRADCGTAGCVAGWAVTFAGHDVEFDDGRSLFSDEAISVTDGRMIDEVAQEVLGLTDDQADELFAETNSLHKLWQLAAEYTDGEIEIPENL